MEDQTALRELTIEMRRGEICCLLGHNGAGKTTTINMLTGLHPPTHGHAFVKGLSIERVGKQIILDGERGCCFGGVFICAAFQTYRAALKPSFISEMIFQSLRLALQSDKSSKLPRVASRLVEPAEL